jgi:hypothetical protein
MSEELNRDPITTGPESTSESVSETSQTTATDSSSDVADKSGANSVSGPDGTTSPADGPQPEESFFDPRDLEGKPELQSAYKQMQGQFTKKMQEISANKHKLAAYNAFEQNPQETIKQLAQQYGLTIAEAKQVAANEFDSFEPQTWQEVFSKASDIIEQRMMGKLSPYLNEVQGLKKQTIEKFMNENAPDWKTYEQDMIEVLRQHPTLASDPLKLYNLVVPPEVIQARATQAAMKKLQSKVNGSKQASGSTTSRHQPDIGGEGLPTFAQAVASARAHMEQGGK